MNRYLALCAVLGVACGSGDGEHLFGMDEPLDAGELLEDVGHDEDAGIAADSSAVDDDAAPPADASPGDDGGLEAGSDASIDASEDAGLDGGELDSSPDASEAGPACLPHGASCAPPWPQFPHLDDCCYPLKCRQFAQNMYSCSPTYPYP